MVDAAAGIEAFFRQMARLAPLGCALFCLQKPPTPAFSSVVLTQTKYFLCFVLGVY